jgi:hypothetical protein
MAENDSDSVVRVNRSGEISERLFANSNMASTNVGSKHYMVYWRARNAASRFVSCPVLDHAGSRQFSRLIPGDVLWFVTVRLGSLILLGRLIVNDRTDWQSAARILRHPITERSSYVVLAAPGTEETMKEMPLDAIADSIRFESPVADRLTIVNGVVNPQQLQTKRRLTDSSRRLFEAEWSRQMSDNIS